MAARLLRYHHATLTIPRGGEDAARAFYGGVLGLREIAKPPGLRPGGLWWENGAGSLQLHLTIQDDIDRASDRAHLAFLTDDLAEIRARLAAAGAPIAEAIAPIPGHARFECRDPFGNRLEFLQVARAAG
ncbi:MAG: VOC family protein [Chloroflexi bacterium]|nr:VOC family protein [Chloroflexota bacterium]